MTEPRFVDRSAHMIGFAHDRCIGRRRAATMAIAKYATYIEGHRQRPAAWCRGHRDVMTIDEITENFEVLDEWDDRYRYVIELGRMLAPFPETARTETNKV